jgi:hypothetical protein
MSFDPANLGLLSHYQPDAQNRIRRLMLEDWKAAGVKLPTYMKLVARFIAPTGVTEDWLAKLSHQTMDKMLKSASTPRYEFWACLHLYLIKKYGPLEIGPTLTDADILGQAVTRFGAIGETPSPGCYVVERLQLDVEASEGKPYAFAQMVEIRQATEPFGVDIERKRQGIAVRQSERLIAILRDIVSLDLSTIEIEAQA